MEGDGRVKQKFGSDTTSTKERRHQIVFEIGSMNGEYTLKSDNEIVRFVGCTSINLFRERCYSGVINISFRNAKMVILYIGGH